MAAKHHFVPRWYLEQFSDSDGFVHLYDKHTNLWRRQKPNKLFRRNGYYKQDWVPEGIDPNIFEQKLAEWLEPSAKNAIEKILAWENDLTAEEWAIFYMYLEIQWLRVPKQASTAKAQLESFVMQIASTDTIRKLSKKQLSLKVSASYRMGFIQNMLGVLVRYFINMDSEIIRAFHGDFVTSDNPVSMFNAAIAPSMHPGIALSGTLVLFPMNPSRLFVLKHPDSESKPPLEIVGEPNQSVESTIVREDIEWDENAVLLHNQIMLELADRNIIASSKELLERVVGRRLNGHKV